MSEVRCPDPELWRPALSARLDGEDPGIPSDELTHHLAVCLDCADWYARLAGLSDRLTGADSGAPDLTRRLIGLTEAHICGCHRGEACECTDCQCADCTCGHVAVAGPAPTRGE